MIILSAHSFFNFDDDGNCLGKKSPEELDDCKFHKINLRGGVDQLGYKINARTLTTGDKCGKPGTIAHDWAVVELKQDVSGVEPFEIFDFKKAGASDANDFAAIKNLPVTTLSAVNTNLRIGNELVDAPTLSDSIMGHFQTQIDSKKNIAYFFTTGSSSGEGNSGGGVGVLSPGKPAALLGIVSASKGPEFDGVEYGPKNFTGGPLIEGVFADAINACRSKCPISN